MNTSIREVYIPDVRDAKVGIMIPTQLSNILQLLAMRMRLLIPDVTLADPHIPQDST